MPDVEKKRKTIINIVYLAIFVVIGFFIVRYAAGVCFPLVFAFIVASCLQKPKNFLTRKTFLKKGAASAICVFLLIIIIIAIVSLIGVRVVNEIQGFIDYIVFKLQNINSLVDTIEKTTNNLIASMPDFLRDNLSESSNSIFTQVREYLAGNNDDLYNQIVSALGGMSFDTSILKTPINGVISTAMQIPSMLVTILVTIVSCCFMTSDYQLMKNFIKAQFPEERKKDLSRASVILKASLGKMAKAYLLIMLVTFIEMTIGLTVLKLIGVFSSNYLIIIALITAVIDIVPVLGTGTVIFPWALYALITGEYGLAIGLVVIYIAISAIRQVIEPKLVAGQLGLSPIVTISAMFLGLKIFGFLGMFIMPILIIMLKLLNDEGIIHVWKSPKKAVADGETEKGEKATDNSDDGKDQKEKPAKKSDKFSKIKSAMEKNKKK